MSIDPIMLALSGKSKGIPRVDLSSISIPVDGTSIEILDPTITEVLNRTCGPLEVILHIINEDAGQTFVVAIFSYAINNSAKMYQFTMGSLLFTFSFYIGGTWNFSATFIAT